MKVPITPVLFTSPPAPNIQPWMVGHTKYNTTPNTIEATEVIIGTNLEPPKNPKNGGNVILLYLLCKNDVKIPTIIPPNTPVSTVWIPSIIPCPALASES